MGLSVYTAKTIKNLFDQHGIPKVVLCLGRQNLRFIKSEIFPGSKNLPESSNYLQDDFFKDLGCETVYTLDVSNYEGAEILCDLNQPISNNFNFIDHFDFIYDGGTFEHIFNIPVALSNLNKMLKINGFVMHCNPSNGFIDHGFYQISPNLYLEYYQINGYDEITCYVGDRFAGYRSYLVEKDLYRLVDKDFGVRNALKAEVVFFGKKSDSTPKIQKSPQQGFYQSRWNNETHRDHDSIRIQSLPSDKKYINRIFYFFIRLVHRLRHVRSL
jgi:hypothetical protein